LGGRGEILSADSVQIYRGLDIGSAKPTPDEKSRARFHLVDIADPDEDFTLADYQRHAVEARGAVVDRGKLPIVCGGTGLYLRALTQPLSLTHVPPDEEFRTRWNTYAAANGVASVHAVLAERDPDAAAKLHGNDLRRIVRALEVLEHTGKRLSEWHREDRAAGAPLMPGTAIFVLNRDRERLYEAIDRRVDQMISAGFEGEVRRLRQAGFPRSLHSMRTLGYNEMNGYLDGETSLPECIESIKRHTRQFARRQLIWFRADPSAVWVDVEGMDVGCVADALWDIIARGEHEVGNGKSRERILQ
jgi:tRNA dimethylallyltransferase